MSVQTCNRCLYSNDHPLGLVIDEEGICSGCRIHEEKDKLDWDTRWHELETLVAPYRSRDARNYDCIVPVTGAGDSHFIVHTVVNKLRLKPLLVTYNRYYNTPLGIHNLANLRRRFNSDILIQNVNPHSVKKIIRTTLRQIGSFHWPAIAGQTAFPVQTAASLKIPLIIWGAHQGLEQVGMFSHLHNVEMTRRYRKDHDLMGIEADDLLNIFDNLNEEDIWQYRYPDWNIIHAVGIRGIYLGNYMRWDPLAQHNEMTKLFNYKGAIRSRTFDTYDHIDDWHYLGLHDQIKQTKTGITKATDQICREIRYGRIARNSGRLLNKYYSTQTPSSNYLLYNWVGLEAESINHVIGHHSKKIITKKNEKNSTTNDNLPNTLKNLITKNLTLSANQGGKHIIIGKGYP